MPQVASQALSLNVTPAPALVVSTATLPDAVEFAAYSQQLTATGGTAPYTWSVTSGALPAGLALSAQGLISGTPTVSGAFNFTVQAQDSGA
jgi:hypothetical protein